MINVHAGCVMEVTARIGLNLNCAKKNLKIRTQNEGGIKISADNYYVVRRHPSGGFTYVMGFASDDDEGNIPVSRLEPMYPTMNKALDAAMAEYSEYGVSVHPECER